MLPLPVPEKGGSLNDLRGFVNVADDGDFALLVGWQMRYLAGFDPRQGIQRGTAMSQGVGIWQLTDDGPRRLAPCSIGLEQELETWIERDPSQRADAVGTGHEFRAIFEAATRQGLYPRAGKASIMFAPQTNRRRCLVTVCTDPSKKGGLWMYVASEAFSEFYGIESGEVVAQLGGNEWVDLPCEKVGQFIEGLDRLLGGEAA